ncbi:hypothetical protein C8R46DRAFT_897874 [Mycena filopes]|nr:hypothetical protein C8R46DRAFT_912137 [Mycena filopes]KAJ7168832.1 hypothetical protein C8R46DRAFT_897874 [Mycena filopes]
MVWDSRDYSCGYDATFTILANVWVDDPTRWTTAFGTTSGTLGELAVLLQSVADGLITLENARNTVRRAMNRARPIDFPYGHNSTSIDRIAQRVFPSKCYAVGRQVCEWCGFLDPVSYGMLESYMSVGLSTRRDHGKGVELLEWVTTYLAKGRQICQPCRLSGNPGRRLSMKSTVREVPPLMLFDLTHDKILFSDKLEFEIGGKREILRLRGIIYGGQGHFTCRYVQRQGQMWFHDGITTGSSCLRESMLQDVDDRLRLHRCGEKAAIAVLYALDV